MSDFFFQTVLFLAGAIIGVAVPLLPRRGQKWIAGILATALAIASLIWLGYELALRESKPMVVDGEKDESVTLKEPTGTPTITFIIARELPSTSTNWREVNICKRGTGASSYLSV